MTMETESVLIEKILSGDKNLYSILVDRYKSYAFTIAFKILDHRPEAEEVAQDAFVKAFHHLKNFNQQAKFSTWLYRIVFNTAISYKRRRKQKMESIETTIIAHAHEGENQLETRDKQNFVQEALKNLNQADRLIISLFYLKEFSLEEMSEITEISAQNLKIRLHRARKKLAEALKLILKEEAYSL